MPLPNPTRTSTTLLRAAVLGFVLPASAIVFAQGAAPIVRRPPPPAAVPKKPATPNVQKGGKLQGEHLAAWMDHHNGETTAQKLQSLEKEPGFHDLPPQTQQRMRDRLLQLESMTPERRERVISRTEAMEKLTPDQRGQIRSVLTQVSALPPASRRAVQRTFRVVRSMPADQRLAYLNSPDIRSQFTDQERDVLQHLMTVEPFLPPGTAVSQQP